MHRGGRQSMFLLLGNAQSFLLVGYIGAVGALGNHRRCTCPYVDRQCLWGKPCGATWSRQFVTALLGFLLFLIVTFFGSSATGLLSAPTFGLLIATKDERVSKRSLENTRGCRWTSLGCIYRSSACMLQNDYIFRKPLLPPSCCPSACYELIDAYVERGSAWFYVKHSPAFVVEGANVTVERLSNLIQWNIVTKQ